MGDLTATERRDRAVKSLSIAEDRLEVINRMLPELETELQNSIVKNEIEGYRNKTIQKRETEIDSLLKEKTSLEKTIEALKKALPEFEKAARVEIASTETVRLYHEGKAEVKELLNRIPSLAGLKAEIENVRQYAERLQEIQGEFFGVLQNLNEILIRENLQSIGDIDIVALQKDRDAIDYAGLLAFSDSLIDLNEEINSLQYKLFKTGTLYMPIQELQPEPVPEYSPCGNYHRICEHGTWTLFEKQYKPRKDSAGYEEIWMSRDSGKIKPEFPTKAEFSEDGRFRIEKGVSRWKLFQKDDEGHWYKIRESIEKPDFPTEPIEVPKEKESKTALEKMAYGNEDKKIRDPDKSTQNV